MSFSLSFLVLSLCLHKETRIILAQNSCGYLLKAVERNPRMLLNFAERAKDMVPFTLEALGFLMERGCFVTTGNGRLRTVEKAVRKKVTGSDESIACQRIARFLGREFARIADRATIYTSLGVRP